MKIYGLTGYPLSHSFSKSYFEDKFRRQSISGCEYLNFPARNPEEIREIVRNNPELKGLNITIPLKEKIIPVLDWLDPMAEQIKAVNTIKIRRKNTGFKLAGFNTDASAFLKSVKPFIKAYNGYALILGTGGAAKAVAYILEFLSIGYLFVSRSHFSGNIILYSNLSREIITSYKLIINATPTGMFPDSDTCPPVPYQYIGKDHIIFDLVYNPEETLFMKIARDSGAKVKNGLEMLYLQAEESWEIWNS
jgi:shikimate dehydrogenase